MRLLTNRRVGTKIMIAVGLVAVFGAGDGLYAMSSLGATNQQVKTGYTHEQELAAIDDLQSSVNKVWLSLDDYQRLGLSEGSNVYIYPKNTRVFLPEYEI